ncbi:MAG: hypothetical protein U0575_05540 [Phycisphaerales bacterium]
MAEPRPPAPPPPPVSALAIVAVALSAALCCPLASLAAAALGVVALLRIHRSEGRLRGQALAIAAIAVAAGSLILQNELAARYGEAFGKQLETSARDRVATLMYAVERGDTAGFGALFSSVSRHRPPRRSSGSAGRPSGYGRYRGMSIVASTPVATLAAPTITMAVTFSFERRASHRARPSSRRTGSCRAWTCSKSPSTTTRKASFKLP